MLPGMGYPMGALVLSLAAYKFPRLIAFEGLASKDVLAARGVVAGSVVATFELMALLLHVIRSIKIKHSKTVVCVHVDDIAATVQGKDEVEVIQQLANLAADLDEEGSAQCKLKFSWDKVFLLASSESLLTRAGKTLGKYGG